MMSTQRVPDPGLEQWSYRDADAALRARRDELSRVHREAINGIGDRFGAGSTAGRIYVQRAARTAAGLAGLLGVACVPLVALLSFAFSSVGIGVGIGAGSGDSSHGRLTLVLLGTPLLAVLAYLVGGRLSARALRGQLLLQLRPTGDLHADIGRLSGWSAEQRTMELADAREAHSVALPLVALSLALPLLLHFGVYFLFGALLDQPTYVLSLCRGFDYWIMGSALLVGHSHLVLAVLSYRHARRLRSTATEDIAVARSGDGFAAWGLTVVSSTVPGLMLYAVPVILVALTGLVFVPAMFSWMNNRVRRERLALAAA